MRSGGLCTRYWVKLLNLGMNAIRRKVLFHAQLQFDVRLIGAVNQSCMRQVSLLLFRFLRENVAFESVFSLDLTASSDRESLLRTGFSFHFWHFSSF